LTQLLHPMDGHETARRDRDLVRVRVSLSWSNLPSINGASHNAIWTMSSCSNGASSPFVAQTMGRSRRERLTGDATSSAWHLERRVPTSSILATSCRCCSSATRLAIRSSNWISVRICHELCVTTGTRPSH
jgi:hypothetical protein